jgi:exopolyphosphatase/guanosine-5'-triphosphate,3'-diphosphate pyrophosphatase
MFRHEGIYEDGVLPEMKALAGTHHLERARILGALLRVVYLFSASMPGLMPRLKWRRGEGDKLSLVVPASHAGLMGERPDGRMAQLSKVLGRQMDIVLGD